MESNPRIFDARTFEEEQLVCPKCGWHGKGYDANVADFYGIGKYQQASCPKCDQVLGSISRDRSFGQGDSPAR